MNTAKEINNLLDQILDLRAEITDDQVLNNITTGEKTNKAGAFKLVEAQINEIKKDLNTITHNGLNVKNIFTNKFYINDVMQDREIVEKGLTQIQK